MKKALVIGGTGMVGKELIKALTESKEYDEIVSFVRSKSTLTHPKLTEIKVDFDQIHQWQDLLRGHTLFSTLGTTIKNAKTQQAQFKVDYEYQFSVAEKAAANGVSSYVLISSAGANSTAANFYLRMKGQLDEAVTTLPFQYKCILRPGQLDGDRLENRLFEKIAIAAMKQLNRIGLLQKYKPIHAREVAKAMIHVASLNQSATYTLDELFQLAAAREIASN